MYDSSNAGPAELGAFFSTEMADTSRATAAAVADATKGKRCNNFISCVVFIRFCGGDGGWQAIRLNYVHLIGY